MIRRLLRSLHEHSGKGYKSRGRQLLDLVELVARGHLHPSEYFLYGLSRSGISVADTANYMSNRFHWESHLAKLNDPRWFALMDNKWLFHLHFQNLVRLPRFLGIYHPIQGVTWDHRALRTLDDFAAFLSREGLSAFVIKPVGGSQGSGVCVVDDVRDGPGGLKFLFRDGSSRKASAFFEPMGARSALRGTGLLIEERLEQHPEILDIAPYTVNTVRVVTLVGKEAVIVPAACIRLGSAGSMVDNFSKGGYCAAIDVESGTIREARRGGSAGAQLETHHADSGTRFAGRTVPLWDRVLKLCTTAAEATPGLRSIGWDVVLTPDGPVMIEGNRDWGILMCQAAGGGFLQTPVTAELRALGVPVNPERLPRVNPRRAISSLLGTWQ